MKNEMTTVFFKDDSAKFGYRKAIVMLDDVEYFTRKGACKTPADFTDEAPKKRGRKPRAE